MIKVSRSDELVSCAECTRPADRLEERDGISECRRRCCFTSANDFEVLWYRSTKMVDEVDFKAIGRGYLLVAHSVRQVCGNMLEGERRRFKGKDSRMEEMQKGRRIG
jgi:hypothetical protein